MIEFVVVHWWIVLLRGVIALLFGLLAFGWPQLTATLLTLFFAAHALIDGAIVLALGLRIRKMSNASPWPQLIVVGTVSLIAGIVALIWPLLTAVTFVYVLALWAICRGAFDLGAAIRLRAILEDEWQLALAGIVSILFGLVLVAWPTAGLVGLIWLIAAHAIIFGVLMSMAALRFRVLRPPVI
jgi:uncharacterized membrane protein HdeD (DUF308 family)